MRALGVGLAIAFIVPVGATSGRADPSAPQISPIHLQREDAQRVNEQQRELDRKPVLPAMAAGPTKPEQLASPVATDRTTRLIGFGLLGAAGLAALASIPFLGDSSGTSSGHEVGGLLLATAVATAIGGAVILSSNASRSSVVLAPAATSHSVGLAIVGRL